MEHLLYVNFMYVNCIKFNYFIRRYFPSSRNCLLYKTSQIYNQLFIINARPILQITIKKRECLLLTYMCVSDGTSNDTCIPIITPTSLLLSIRGRIRLRQNQQHLIIMGQTPPHLISYMPPEYQTNKRYTDTEIEKVRIEAIN